MNLIFSFPFFIGEPDNREINSFRGWGLHLFTLLLFSLSVSSLIINVYIEVKDVNKRRVKAEPLIGE